VPAVRTDAHATGDGLSAEIALHVVNRRSESTLGGSRAFIEGKRMGLKKLQKLDGFNGEKVHWVAQGLTQEWVSRSQA
jgi:hypothetical protein